MTKTDEGERRGFLAALEADPTDAATRLVYADWLDDHDLPEEAARQRAWPEAYRLPAEVADPYALEPGEDGEGRPAPPRGHDHREVLAEIAWWEREVARGDLCFGNTRAQDRLADEGERERFWRAFEVVTGASPPDELRRREFYNCAC